MSPDANEACCRVIELLSECKAEDGGEKNLTSRTGYPAGGKYLIPENRVNEFFKLLCHTRGYLANHKVYGLAAQAKGRTLSMHIVDLDFDMTENYEILNDIYICFFEKLLMNIRDEQAQCIICMPTGEKNYQRKFKGRSVWHTGVHGFIVLDRPVSRDESIQFRKNNLNLVAECFRDIPGLEAPSKIWDEKIAKRSTGVFLSYTGKPNANGHKQPQVFIGKDNHKTNIQGPEVMNRLLDEQPEMLYKFMNQLYRDQLLGLPETKTRVPRLLKAPVYRTFQPDKVATTNEDGFQGDYFINWAIQKGWARAIPLERDDWKLVVSYFAGCGYDPEEYGEKLTTLFDPVGACDVRENTKMMQNNPQ